jgi:hypothetical protein
MKNDGWKETWCPTEGARAFLHPARGLAAIRGRERGRWHLSISHRDRVPTWGEIGFARDALLPAGTWMMIPHPPRQHWMNVHPHVLHLWEFHDEVLIEQFKLDGEMAAKMGKNIPDDGE